MTSQEALADSAPQPGVKCAPSPRPQRADGQGGRRPLQAYHTAPMHPSAPAPVQQRAPCPPPAHHSSTPHLAGPVPQAASLMAETLPTAVAQPVCLAPAATIGPVPDPAAAGAAQAAALPVRAAVAGAGAAQCVGGCGPGVAGVKGGTKRPSVDLGGTVFAFPMHSTSAGVLANSPRSAPSSPPVACPPLSDHRDTPRAATSPTPDLTRSCARPPLAGSPGGRVSTPVAGEGEHQTGRFVIRPLRPAVPAPPAASPGTGPWPASTVACADSCRAPSSSPEAGPQPQAVREAVGSVEAHSSSSGLLLAQVGDQLAAQAQQLAALTALVGRQAQDMARLADTASRQGELTARLLRAQGLGGDEPKDMADTLVLLDCENETLRRANEALRARVAQLEARLGASAPAQWGGTSG